MLTLFRTGEGGGGHSWPQAITHDDRYMLETSNLVCSLK